MSRALQIVAFAVAFVALVALAPPKLASASEGAPQRIVNTVPDVARPLALTAVRLTGGPLKRAQELDAKYCWSSSPIACSRSTATRGPRAEGAAVWRLGRRRQKPTGHIAALSRPREPDGRRPATFDSRSARITSSSELKAVQDKHGDGYSSALAGGRHLRRPSKGNHQVGRIRSERPMVAVARCTRRSAVCATPTACDNRTALDVEVKFAA